MLVSASEDNGVQSKKGGLWIADDEFYTGLSSPPADSFWIFNIILLGICTVRWELRFMKSFMLTEIRTSRRLPWEYRRLLTGYANTGGKWQ